MNSIDIMMNEHRMIERGLKVLRKLSLKVLNEHKVEFDDFEKAIDFVKNYADGHHHNKEEVFLFNEMVENLGPLGEKTITHGMLVEHDLGRLFIKNLGEALEKVKEGNEESMLDVIANAIGYTDLLERHIFKEDNVIYKFAIRELNQDIKDKVDSNCENYEKDNESTKDKYLTVLEELEMKYVL